MKPKGIPCQYGYKGNNMTTIQINYPPEYSGSSVDLSECPYNGKDELQGKIIYTKMPNWVPNGPPEIMGRVIWPNFEYSYKRTTHLVELFKTARDGSNEYAVLDENAFWVPDSGTSYMIGDRVCFTKRHITDYPEEDMKKRETNPGWRGVVISSKHDRSWNRVFQIAWEDGTISWEVPKYIMSYDEHKFEIEEVA